MTERTPRKVEPAFKHIVVTGGAGFVGSNLVLELQRRFPDTDITIVDDFRSGNFKNLEGFKGDIIAADVKFLDMKHYFGGRKVDLFFHLASITDTTDHNQFRQTNDNVESWRNLLNYLRGPQDAPGLRLVRRHLRHRGRPQQGRSAAPAGEHLRVFQGAAR